MSEVPLFPTRRSGAKRIEDSEGMGADACPRTRVLYRGTWRCQIYDALTNSPN